MLEEAQGWIGGWQWVHAHGSSHSQAHRSQIITLEFEWVTREEFSLLPWSQGGSLEEMTVVNKGNGKGHER